MANFIGKHKITSNKADINYVFTGLENNNDVIFCYLGY